MPIRKYVVVPPMEGMLEDLREISANLWFSWNPEAVELFVHLDEVLWEQANHNPQQVLIGLSSSRLNEIRADEGYRSYAEKVRQRLRTYMKRQKPYEYRLDQPVDFTTAYFSLEFGITECLPIYSGGLGVLAGDHLKSASDLNLPLVGVGLMYEEGYFHQRLTHDGWQQEVYPPIEMDTLPVERQIDASGNPILVHVDLAGEPLAIRIFKATVGRVPLYLLDTDMPENPPHLRKVTARLYGGDLEMRIRQEMILGIGGRRALRALGIEPSVYHLNEGHAAFTLIEGIRHFVEEKGLSLEEATEVVTSQSVLTIHTPVPAGVDVFPRHLMEPYFRNFIQDMGMDFDYFMGLGKTNPKNLAEGFCMPVLGLKLTSRTNGVSKLHAQVARKMWREVWRRAEVADVPIVPVTNGVHIPSYISRDLAKLYDRYLGPGWNEDPDNEKIWTRAIQIPDVELWRTHERSRSRLVHFARSRLARQLQNRGASPQEIDRAKAVLDPEALTVCFARRFATYKRANLLFKDPQRLAAILDDAQRPVQVLFAGKAHPADDLGKELIRSIVEMIKEEPFRGRIVFLEDYDLRVARHMVQGADVWLNTPRRPLEACGTSGMKAAANGALNLSILDGWWDEGYLGDNGWAIGSGEEYQDTAYQDEIESRALYDLLEESVKPIFFERGVDDLPRNWTRMMKRCIRTVCPVFNSHRMVSDYVETCYVPSAQNFRQLQADEYKVLRDIVAWKKSLRADWTKLAVLDLEVKGGKEAVQGKEVEIVATLNTAGHSPDELTVEVVHGPLDLWENFKVRYITSLSPVNSSPEPGAPVDFSGLIHLEQTGLYGYEVRVTPYHPNLSFSHRFYYVHRG